MKRLIATLFIVSCLSFGCAPHQKTATSDPTDQPLLSATTPELKIAPFERARETEALEAALSSGPPPMSMQAQVISPELTPPLFPQATEASAPTGIGLNFDNADIYDVTKVVSEITKKSFIIDKSVQGTVTVFSEASMTPDQVFELYKSVLELNGLAITQVGDFYKIVPSEDAQKRYLDVDSGTLLSPGDRLVTQIVKLKHVSAENVKDALKNLLPTGKEVVVYPNPEEGDTLIITDIASNVQKILGIIEQIDVSQYAGQYFEVFLIKHSDLTDVVSDLNQILSIQDSLPAISTSSAAAPEIPADAETAQPAVQPTTSSQLIRPGTRTNLHPIPRLNAFVVTTNNPEVIAMVRTWVAVLDQVPVNPIKDVEADKDPMTHVYHVRYAEAEKLADTLTKLYEGAQAAPTPEGEPEAEPGRTEPAAGQDSVPAPVFIADVPTNFLIVKATLNQYAQIKKLLDQLDHRPLQVLIDVIIAEVSLVDTDIFGVQGMLMGQDQVTIGGETNSIETTSETLFSSVFPEDGQGFRFALTAPGRFLAQLRALATENRVKVLSAPHVIVQNNQKASINVGERIPVKEVTGTGDDTRENVNYQDTGIILTVTPQISPGNDVLMEIVQEVSDVGKESFGDTGAASFTTRKSETKLVTRDGYPLVIGGLITKRTADDRQGVPVLKDLPVIGRVFRYKENKTTRTELIILVTPRIVRTPEEGWELTDDVLGEKIKRLEQFFNTDEPTDAEKINGFFRNTINIWKPKEE